MKSLRIFKSVIILSAAVAVSSCVVDSSDRDRLTRSNVISYAYRVECNTLLNAFSDLQSLLTLSDLYDGKAIPEEIPYTIDYRDFTVKTDCNGLRTEGAVWHATTARGSGESTEEIKVKALTDTTWNYTKKDANGCEAEALIVSTTNEIGESLITVSISGTYEVETADGKDLKSTFFTPEPALYVGSLVGTSGKISYDYELEAGYFTVLIWKKGEHDHWCSHDLSDNPMRNSFVTDLDE